MTRFKLACPAAVSALALAGAVVLARPQYGGLLRVETQAAIRTLDPAQAPADASDAAARARLLPLVFETLVAPDRDGGIRPLLATAWEHDARAMRWRFRLRGGVKLHDGSVLEASSVAAGLRGTPSWKVAADADTVVIESDREMPDLLWELAKIQYAVAIRRPAGEPIGTGPFRIDRLEGGQAADARPATAGRLLLRAHEEYWAGRPFVDAVQIEMGRSPSDQLSSLEVGRADIAGLAAADALRLSSRGMRIAASRPVDLVALVFEDPRATPAAEPLRRAVALTVDRSAMCAVLLQRWAEPATTILPDWLTGYASVVAADRDHDRASARALAAKISAAQRTLALRVEGTAAVDRVIAERIAVDAREIGLAIKIDPADALAPRPDVRLVHVKLEATSPDRALAAAFSAFGPRVARALAAEATLPPAASLDDVYRLERALLERRVIVPIVHLPELYALGPHIESWSGPVVLPSGGWDLANVWIKADKP